MNAQIARKYIYQLTIGNQGFHNKTNNNGRRLINSAAFRNLVIASTMSEHKNIHKITWRSPDGQYFIQLDYILIDSRHI
jgi:hypothetical protein